MCVGGGGGGGVKFGSNPYNPSHLFGLTAVRSVVALEVCVCVCVCVQV